VPCPGVGRKGVSDVVVDLERAADRGKELVLRLVVDRGWEEAVQVDRDLVVASFEAAPEHQAQPQQGEDGEDPRDRGQDVSEFPRVLMLLVCPGGTRRRFAAVGSMA